MRSADSPSSAQKHVPGGSAFESRLRARALERLADAWLLEEFDSIIEGRGLKSLAEYQTAARPDAACRSTSGHALPCGSSTRPSPQRRASGIPRYAEKR